jgi:hypothetical protein
MDAVGTDDKMTLVDRPIFRDYRATDGGALNADGPCGQPNSTLVWVVLVEDFKQLLSVEKGYGESEPIWQLGTVSAMQLNICASSGAKPLVHQFRIGTTEAEAIRVADGCRFQWFDIVFDGLIQLQLIEHSSTIRQNTN